MSITKDDLQKIGGVVDEKLDKRFDDFAVIVNNGFTKTHELIEKNAQGIERNSKLIERNALAIDRNAKAIDRNAKKIDRNCERIDNLSTRFDLLEKEVRDIRKQIYKCITFEQFSELEERLTIVEAKLGIKY